jgi:hypothetical protein
MGRVGARRAALVTALVTVVQAVAGITGPATVSAAVHCHRPRAVFTVDGSTGHLVELASCPRSLTRVGVVDRGDWRTAKRILATGDARVTVVYRITADGRLEARRQRRSGARLEAPVEVGAGIDWARFRSVIVPRRGFLWADDDRAGEEGTGGSGYLRAFRHEGWNTRGTEVVEHKPLYDTWPAMPAADSIELMGLTAAGYAEAVGAGGHWRLWVDSFGGLAALSSGGSAWHLAGTEGSGVYAAEPGAVLELTQPPDTRPENVDCPGNGMRWQVRRSLPGYWWPALAVPQRLPSTTEWPELAPLPAEGYQCPPGTAQPYQWQ